MKPLVLIAAGACLMSSAQAFAPLSAATPFRTSSPMTLPHKTRALAMTPLDEVLSDSSLVQAEICNGITHTLLDFTSLWGGAATKMRLAAVLGRLFLIGQDFQRDVLPDELAFQLFLLAVACHGLMGVLVPKWKAKFFTPSLMTFPDRQAFRSLFRPAGVSWENFKELHSESMDWVQVEPGHVLLQDEDDSVYWIYQGDVQVWSNQTLSHHISGRQEVAGLGLLGEGRLAKLLDNRASSKESKKALAGLKAVAGETGATLLRINTTKLEKLLQHDQDLTHAIHRLAFMGMQDKLDALLLKEASAPVP